MKRQNTAVALLLAGIAAVSMGLTALCYERPQPTSSLTVTASFYPLYTAALQVVGDTDGVTVTCLTAPTAGCMHDYQLSPDEMASLTDTDILVVNGWGTEAFLEQALSALPALQVVDTSAGITALESPCHDHHEEHAHHNEHTWLSPALYAKQVENLRDGLCAADPSSAARYTENAATYLAAIEQVQTQFESLSVSGDGAVLFHSSVAYTAQQLKTDTLAYLPLGEEEGLSAAALVAAADAIRGRDVWFLYDEQVVNDTLNLAFYAARVRKAVIRTAVRPMDGVADKDTWLVAMAETIKTIKEAAA